MMKLYKRTIIVANIMTGVFFILSVICEFFEFAHKAIIQSYASGIVCSLIVVIVTTYLQFKHEQNRLLDEIASSLNSFFLHRYFAIRNIKANRKNNNELWEHLFKKITKSMDEVSSESREICFFNKEKEKKVLQLCGTMQLIQVDYVGLEFLSEQKAIENIVFNEGIDKIEELYRDVIKDGIDKNLIMCFVDRTKKLLEEENIDETKV